MSFSKVKVLLLTCKSDAYAQHRDSSKTIQGLLLFLILLQAIRVMILGWFTIKENSYIPSKMYL